MFICPEPLSRAVRFLDDAEFFVLHEGLQRRPDYRRRDTSIPLQRLKNEQRFNWVYNEMLPWLSPTITVSRAALTPFCTSVLELFNNITDHARYDMGCVFVQYFPQLSTVTISIADWGEGIPTEVRRVRPDLADADAILAAAAPGFSTKLRPSKRGAGLDYLLETVVRSNGGTVDIMSGNVIVRFMADGARVAHRIDGLAGQCPGTTIDITFYSNRVLEVPEQPEDLEW